MCLCNLVPAEEEQKVVAIFLRLPPIPHLVQQDFIVDKIKMVVFLSCACFLLLRLLHKWVLTVHLYAILAWAE